MISSIARIPHRFPTFGFRSFHSSPSCYSIPLGHKIAFTFDIDGVLLRGKSAIPESKAALNLLNKHQIPWILLTNGGGQSERARAEQLTNTIGVKVSASQVVQAHTPFRALANKYHRVLVIGGEDDRCRKVAEEVYGFQDVVIPADIVKADPSVSPFRAYNQSKLDLIGRDRRIYEHGSGEAKIDAILVFNDPRDLATDLQITLDLLVSQHGYVGTLCELNARHKEAAAVTDSKSGGVASSLTSKLGKKYQQYQKHTNTDLSVPSIPIYFCCDDFLWANEYRLARLGQGAFRIMVEQMYKQMTHGAQLQSTVIGKPYEHTYQYAESVLQDWRAKHFGATNNIKDTTVFMVGDNPASDIMGANNYGWYSLLVRTGVFRDEDLPSIVAAPKQIVDNVEKAVEYGIAHGLAV